MAKATNAITKTFIKEGKISYSNNDKGGLTYLGLSYIKWPNAEIWPEVFKIFQEVKPSIGIDTLKNIGTSKGIQISLTDQEEDLINSKLEPLRKKVILFYKKEFWDTLNADGILCQTFAESFFDFSVNVGSGTGAKILQKYLNVDPDGNIGPITIGKLNHELLVNTYNCHIDFTTLKIKKYGKICEDNPNQIVNLHGWLNRSFEVFNEFFSIEIISSIYKNKIDLIPSELQNDIKKLIELFELNNKYDTTRSSSDLSALQRKIIEN